MRENRGYVNSAIRTVIRMTIAFPPRLGQQMGQSAPSAQIDTHADS
jgi:hypothetical protein